MCILIFITVGNHDRGFERLEKMMDYIAGKIDEKVIMQTGYKPKFAKCFDFIEHSKMMESNHNARIIHIILGHAGAGSILTAMEHDKPIIIVPRLEKYGEHNDHQLPIANAISNNKLVKDINNIGDIEDNLKFEFTIVSQNNDNRLASKLKKYLSSSRALRKRMTIQVL